ncbi:MAG: iron-sulfur cluster assembly protein [Anaerolineales bacterium]|jgi:metal-sulfur cluster biosynthetic enzyme
MSDAGMALKREVVECLKRVIDPETQVDVIRMQLVQDLIVNSEGVVEYTFRPSSPLCPIAVGLAVQIKRAVAEVPGVMKQIIKVEGYLEADELTRLINKEV